MDPLAHRFDRYRTCGDLGALGEVFDVLAPRLLAVALHVCGNPADAEDTLQQTFLLAIDQAASFDASRRLEPWLAGLLVNAARNLRRHERRRAGAELPDLADGGDGPVAAAERTELASLLRTRIDALPVEQRQALRLQLQHGMSPAEIAEVLEVAPGTVRMRLHRGLQALRRLLPATLAAWFTGMLAPRGLAAVRVAVLAEGRARAAAAVVPAFVVGGLAMKKLVVAFVVLVAMALFGWSVARDTALPVAPAAERELAASARAEVGDADPAAPAVTPATVPPRIEADARGDVRVQVVASRGAVAGAPLPLASVLIDAWPGDSPLVPFGDGAHRLATDANGEAVLAGVAAGPWRVQLVDAVARDDAAVHSVQVEPGGEAVVRIERAATAAVHGIVVDADGVPVEGAEVWIHRGTATGRYSMPEPAALTARCAARSGPDGRFRFAALAREGRVGASRAGYGESFGATPDRAGAELRLVLVRAFASVAGTVRGARGEPVAGALVQLTSAGQDARRTRDGTLLGPRVDRLVRTDGAGRYRFDGLAPGRVRVWATAWPRTFATAEPQLAAFANAEVDLRLEDGVTVVGTVRNADGSPARVALFSTPRLPANGHFCHCESREDGSFELFYQPRGPFVVCVGWQKSVVASREFADPAPGLVRCDFVLPRASCRGRVLGPAGEPLREWWVVARPADGDATRTRTDGDGGFTIGVPVDRPVVLTAHAPDGHEARPAARIDVAPGTPDCELRVPAALAPNASLRGRLVDRDGAPLQGETVLLSRAERHHEPRRTTTAADGAFAFPDVAAGEYVLQAGLAAREVARATVRAGEHLDVGELEGARRATLRVEYVHADGSPWLAAAPGVILRDAAGARAEIEVAHDERALLVRTEPGTWIVEPAGTDLLVAPQTVELVPGGAHMLRFALAIGRSRQLVCNGDGRERQILERALNVRVRDGAGAVVVETVVKRPLPDLRGFAAWHLERVFAFGRYEVEAWTAAGWRYGGTFVVSDDLEEPNRIDVPRRDH